MGLRRTVSMGVLGVVALLSAGCRFETHKDGNNDNVKFATPFGGLSVKTNAAATQAGIGLDVYPGALLEKKEKGEDEAANVNLNFAGFHLGVQAAGYTTPDSPEKVLAFYRKALTKYGTVIQCRDKKPVGEPVRTQDGLTCADNDKNVHVNGEDRSTDELKAGSKLRQHIAAVEPRGAGTKFGLVYLELPSGLNLKDSDEKQ